MTVTALDPTRSRDQREVPPHVHAERCVLGAMMLDPAAADTAAQALRGRDYALPRHELIHEAAVDLHAEGCPTDPVAVADRLGRSGDLARAGGHAYLHELVSEVPAASAVGYYADIVREAAQLRAIRTVGARLQQIGEADGTAEDAAIAARAELDRVFSARAAEVDNATAVDEAIAALDAPPGMPTRWPQLTDALAGWVPGELIVCAARPAIGKSIVGVEATIDCARRGKTAVLASLEMSRVELYHRMLSCVSGVDGSRIRHRTLTSRDREELDVAAEHLKGLPLVVHADTGLSVPELRMLVARHQTRGEVGLVTVDYLTKLSAPKGVSDRRVQVDQITWGLKMLAIELRVPVLALAQLNRAAENGRPPVLPDLRESGEIEATADSVILMDRDRTTENGGDPSALRLAVAKNRHGPTVELEFLFQGHRSRVTDQSGWAA